MQGRWERSQWGGVELADKTLGVLGFGRIGREVARRAVGLNMKVLAYDPFVPAERFRDMGVESGTLDEVLGARRVPDPAPATDRRTRAGRSTTPRSRRCATACASSMPPVAT